MKTDVSDWKVKAEKQESEAKANEENEKKTVNVGDSFLFDFYKKVESESNDLRFKNDFEQIKNTELGKSLIEIIKNSCYLSQSVYEKVEELENKTRPIYINGEDKGLTTLVSDNESGFDYLDGDFASEKKEELEATILNLKIIIKKLGKQEYEQNKVWHFLKSTLENLVESLETTSNELGEFEEI